VITGVPSRVADLGTLYNDVLNDALFVARDNTLMAGLVTQFSDTTYAPRYVPIYNEITASTVSEGGTPSTQQLTKGTADTITPQTIAVKVPLTDERKMTDPDSAPAAVSLEAGLAIAKKLDTDLLGEFANLTQDFGAAGSALTVRRCAAAVAYIRAQNSMSIPAAVLHPYTWYSVFNELTQNGVTTRAANAADVVNTAMRDFWVNDYQGAQWYTSSNLGTGTAVVNGIFAREAIALDTRTPMAMEFQRDPDSRSDYFFFNMRYGTGTPRPTFGCKLTATASVPSSF
jgi:hypothetical protein